LDCYADYQNGETEKYVAAILALKKEVDMDVKDAELHARFSGENSTDEEAAEGWFKLMDKYLSEPIVAADLQTAASSLKSTFSESDWQRLKALKQEIISRVDR
jgi:hypothetical protein